MEKLRPLTDADITDILEIFPDADISLISGIYYFKGWSDWEEDGGVLIFEGIDGSIQMAQYGHSVMCPFSKDGFELEEITPEKMEKIISEWEQELS